MRSRLLRALHSIGADSLGPVSTLYKDGVPNDLLQPRHSIKEFRRIGYHHSHGNRTRSDEEVGSLALIRGARKLSLRILNWG